MSAIACCSCYNYLKPNQKCIHWTFSYNLNQNNPQIHVTCNCNHVVDMLNPNGLDLRIYNPNYECTDYYYSHECNTCHHKVIFLEVDNPLQIDKLFDTPLHDGYLQYETKHILKKDCQKCVKTGIFTYNVFDHCSKCKGTGGEVCFSCRGLRTYPCSACNGADYTKVCTSCKGSRCVVTKQDTIICPSCNDSKRGNVLDIKITD
jgi:hypothetical protein